MSRITVIGGTGYAGAAIVEEAAVRGHQVTALSRSAPQTPVAGVNYVHGDAVDEAPLSTVIADADIVVAALAPRGPLTHTFREVNRTIARLADAAGATLYVVGGFSSLRPAPGADRFVADLSDLPAEVHDEVLAGAALILEDLPATPQSLDWVFVSPPRLFGSFAPGEKLGRYLLGDDVAVEPVTGGKISAPDYALGLVDLVEKDTHHRAHVNLGNPV
ncbi:NAD-dependent dehydratase [Mycobacterium sp. MS1601]|uniref:NAD(P)-dependent oxidoreductase n=1 Tax=Mycobacterium sp. MS1601 TaxID=1936029 RepID=UPI0009790B78|nr:NAD(P)H-binding protein [Mycobacterium sp. MS1601]AQA05352.1 NAD-dependent dehydratase [Mycobacterium sp. MS1601]